MIVMQVRQEELRRRLMALGFDAVRFTRIGPVPAAGFNDWLARGFHADMAWMERTAVSRLRPELVFPGARSVIMLGVNYWDDPELPGRPPGGGGPIWARYAVYEDYHDTIKPALVAAGRTIEELYGAQGDDYRYYVDTGPLLERGWAERTGIGFLGKNGMLISRQYGNWLLLAGIITSVELEADGPLRAQPARPAAEGAGRSAVRQMHPLHLGMPDKCDSGNRDWSTRGVASPTRRLKTRDLSRGY